MMSSTDDALSMRKSDLISDKITWIFLSFLFVFPTRRCDKVINPASCYLNMC